MDIFKKAAAFMSRSRLRTSKSEEFYFQGPPDDFKGLSSSVPPVYQPYKSEITEVISRSLEKSFIDKTPANSQTTPSYLIPPPKSSIDRSRDKRDSLRSSSDCRARSYLQDAEESVKAVQKMSDLLKFNNEQCKYLCDKLDVVVQSARSVLIVLEKTEVGTTSRKDDTDFVKIFELLMILGKQIESFVEGCCKENWIQAAMVLTNVSEYVSSLGFNLELCKVAFGKNYAASGYLSKRVVVRMKKSEAEVVKLKASLDTKLLVEDVVLLLNTLQGEDRDLVTYLLRRLLQIERIPSTGSGTCIRNMYDLVQRGEQVGRGASAIVYRATWLGTQVAMKAFRRSENEEIVEFEKEVEILSRLCHPNITSMFCFKKTTRTCSIVMELMDGDLNELMLNRCEDSSDSHPFPVLEAVDIMLQIGEGVNYLHNEGIVHRDLKPGNILYQKVKKDAIGYVHVKVADFGISKVRDTSTTDSDLTRNTGTTRWMAPEIIGRSDGNKSGMPKYPFKLDSYSFGLLCYEILVGREPFWECKSINEIKKRILKKERPILPCNPSECPPMLKALIEKCWSHEPEERPRFGLICGELTYIKYSLMTGVLMKHGVDENRTRENIADGNSAMSDCGDLDSEGDFRSDPLILRNAASRARRHAWRSTTSAETEWRGASTE